MSSGRLHVLVCLGLAVLTLVCLGKVCNCGFIALDDPGYVVNNPFVQKGLTAETCVEALTTFRGGLWLPMTWLSLQLDSSLYGYEAVAEKAREGIALAAKENRPLEQKDDLSYVGAWGFHVTNLVLHLANVLLAYGLFWRMTGAVARSALVAALFAIHPLHVEPVAWVTERKDVLSAFFFLLALWAYVSYVRKPTIARYLPVLLLAFLGMASKPMVVTLPAVLLLLDYWPLGRLDWGQDLCGGAHMADKSVRPTVTWQRALLEKVPLFALSLGCSLLTMHTHRGAITSLPLDNRLAGSVVGYGWFLQKTLFPSDLCVLYLYHEKWVFSPPEVLLLLFLLVVTYLVAAGARRRPYAAVGWFWFLGMLFPVIGLLQSGMAAYADRFSYLPHLGLFLWLVWAAADLCDRWMIPRLVRIALAGAVIGLLGWATFQQTAWWKDTPAMFERCWNLDNKNHRAAYVLAEFYLYRSDYRSAIAWGKKALAEGPQEPEYFVSLALAHVHLGQRTEAEALINELLHLPADSKAHFHAAIIYDALGQYEKALQQLLQQLKTHPADAEVHNALGQTYEHLGQREEAEKHLKRARELSATER